MTPSTLHPHVTAPVLVYGAYGHTGRFVVDSLLAVGLRPILAGRNGDKLRDLGARYPELSIREVGLDRPAPLVAALSEAGAVINCAGPFLDTAAPLIEAALQAGIHYVDTAAEQESVRRTLTDYATPAQHEGVVILPAMAFFGGLADLLATAAAGDWVETDSIAVGIALDGWHPTEGTRRTGRRNHYPRRIFVGGQLVPLEDTVAARSWDFAAPWGSEPVREFPLAEVILLSAHLQTGEIRTYLNQVPLRDLHDATLPPPTATDRLGRSGQQFRMEVEVRLGNEVRRRHYAGRDIYAFTAPLAVEAVRRLLRGAYRRPGAVAPGEVFPADDFLGALAAYPLLSGPVA